MKHKFAESPFFNVFLFSLFWALQIFISKLGFNQGALITPFIVQSTLIAIIILSLYVLPQKITELRKLPKNILVGILIANSIHFGFGGFLSTAGIALTTAINAGFLIQFSVVTTSILAWVILKEKVTPIRLLMIILVMTGSFFLITKGQLSVPQAGDLLILLACLSWSTGNVLVRRILINTPVSADIVSFLRPIAGLPIFLFLVLISSYYPTSVQQIFQTNLLEIRAGLYVVSSGVFTVLLWLFLNRTLKIATASYMTLMSSLTPILVAILSVLILKERLGSLQLFGALMIIASSFVSQLSKVSKS